MKVKQDAERQRKEIKEAMKLRQEARSLRREALRKLREAKRKSKRARQARKREKQAKKKEEMMLSPKEEMKMKGEKSKRKLVNKTVKKILLRAPLSANEKPYEKKVMEKSNHGWRAGLREAPSEIAPARQCKKLPSSQVLKLLKKAMNLAKTEGSNLSKTCAEVATDTSSRPTVSTTDDAKKEEQIIPAEDFKDLKQKQLVSDQGEARLGLGCQVPHSSPSQKQQHATVEHPGKVMQLDQEGRETPEENSISKDDEGQSETRRRSRITEIRKHVKLRRRAKGDTRPLVSSSEEEGEEEVRTRSKKLKRVKRARAKTPTVFADLTSDSEEEKSKHEELLERKSMKATGNDDLRGGGGSDSQTWLEMALEIMKGVRRAHLPLILPLNDITEGDGNCFFRAACSQCQRPDVNVPQDFKGIDHELMRKKICNFMLKSQLPCVQKFRRNWNEQYQVEYGDYVRYWKHMAKPKVWAEGPVLPATAWCLETSINIVSERAHLGEPFLTFNGNQDGSDKASASAPLWLGHLTGKHYQTLLPEENMQMPQPPKMKTFQDASRPQAKASCNGDQQPGTSKTSREVDVSMMHYSQTRLLLEFLYTSISQGASASTQPPAQSPPTLGRGRDEQQVTSTFICVLI